MFKKLKIIFEDNKGYVAVLLAVLIPIIISSFYLYVRYDNIDSEQTALSIATRDAALAAVSNYSTGVTKTKKVGEKVDFDSQKKYILRKAVNAFNSTIVAKRGLGEDVINMNDIVKHYNPISYTEEIYPYAIYKKCFYGQNNTYRLADLDNPFGPEYPAYSDIIMLRKLDDSSFTGKNSGTIVGRDDANDNTPQLNVDERQISITQDLDDPKALIVTTTIKPKTGDSEIDKNKIITTSYKATPPTCKADIILAVPTNHAAFTNGNSIADDILRENYENTPIYAIKHALRRFVKNFMFYDGIRFGVIPYSGKVSVDADNSTFIGTLNTFRYQDKEKFWPSDTLPEIPISNSYYVKGSCGEDSCEDIKNNFAPTDTFFPVIGIMAHEFFFKNNNEKFYKQPVDICYGGDISLYSGKCKKNTKFYPNPFPILPLTANTYDVFNYLLMLNPYEYKDSPDQNLSSFLFLPFSIADLMFKEKFVSEQQGGTRKKIMIIIANHPDFFAPREMTFLGFDNDACNIPMLDGERLNFEKYYGSSNGDATLIYEDGKFYNKVIDKTELEKYRKNTRITVEGRPNPTYGNNNYEVTLPAPNPVRIVVKNVFTVAPVYDTAHGCFFNGDITLTEGDVSVQGSTLELEGFKGENESTTIKLSINRFKGNASPVIAKLEVFGVQLSIKSNSGYILAVDDKDYTANSDAGSYYVYVCKNGGTNQFNYIDSIDIEATPATDVTYPVLSYAVVDGTGYLLSGKSIINITPNSTKYSCSGKYNAKIEANCYETWTEKWTEWTDGNKTIDNAPSGNWIDNSATTCTKKLTGNCGVASIKISLGDSVQDAQITSIAINEIKCRGAGGYLGDKELNANEISLWLTNTKPLNTGQDSCKDYWIGGNSGNRRYLGADVNKDHRIKNLAQTKSDSWKQAFDGTSEWNNDVFPWPYSHSKDTYLIYHCATNQTDRRGYNRITKLTVYYKTSTTKTANKTENKSLGCDKHNCTNTHTFCTGAIGRNHLKSIKLINTTENPYQTISIPQSTALVSIGEKALSASVQGMRVFFVPKRENYTTIKILLQGCKLLSVESSNNLYYTPDPGTTEIKTFETKLNNLDVTKESLNVSDGKNVSENEIITYENNTIKIHKDLFDPINGKITVTVKKINPTINGKPFSIYDLTNRSENTGDYELAQNSSFSSIGSKPDFVGANLNYYWCTGYKYKYNDISLENPFIHYKWCWKFIFYVICESYWVSTKRSASGPSGTGCIADKSSFTAKIKYGPVSECYRPLRVTIGGYAVYDTNYCNRIGETHNNAIVYKPGELVASSDTCATGSHLAKDLSISAEITSGNTPGCRGLKFNKWPYGLGGSFSKLYVNVAIPDSTISVGGSAAKKIESDTEELKYVFSNNARSADKDAIKINPNNGEFRVDILNAEIVSITYEGGAPVMYDRKNKPSRNARWINFGSKDNSRPDMNTSVYDTFGGGGDSNQYSKDCVDCVMKNGENLEECDCCKEVKDLNTAKTNLERLGISNEQSKKNACEVDCGDGGMEDPCKEVDVCNGPVCANHPYKTEENWKNALDNFDKKYMAVLEARKNLGEISDYKRNGNWIDGINADVQDRFTIENDYMSNETSAYKKAKDTYEMNVEVYSNMSKSEGELNADSSLKDGQSNGNKVTLAYEIPDYCMNEKALENNRALHEACKQKVEDDLIVNKIEYYKLIPGMAEEITELDAAIKALNKAEKNLEEHLLAGNGAYLTYDSGEKDISSITQFSNAKKESDSYDGNNGILNYLKYTQQETNDTKDELGNQIAQTITKTLFVYPKNTTEVLPNDITAGADQKYYTRSDNFITKILQASEVIIPEIDNGKDYQNAYYRAPKLSESKNLIGSVICGTGITFSSKNEEVKTNTISVGQGYIDPCIEVGIKDSQDVLCSTLCTGETKKLHDAVENASESLTEAETAADAKCEELKKALEDAESALGTIDDVWDENKGDDGNTAFARLKHYGVELLHVDDNDESKKGWYQESCYDGLHNPATPKYPAGTKVAICSEKCELRQDEHGNFTNVLNEYNEKLVNYENMKNRIKLAQQKTETNEYFYNSATGYFETSDQIPDSGIKGFNMALFPRYSTADITVLLENRYDLQKNEILSSYDITKDTNSDKDVYVAEGVGNFMVIDYLNGLNSFFLPYCPKNAKNAFVGPSSVFLVNDDGAWLKIQKQSTRLVFAEFTNPINRTFANQSWQKVNEDEERKVTESPTNVLANSALKHTADNVMSSIDKVYFIIYNNNQLEYVKKQLKNYNKKIIYKTAKNKDELEKVLDEIAKEIEVESPTAERIN